MPSMYYDLFVAAERYGSIKSDDEAAWRTGDCPFCGGTQFVVIAYARDEPTAWLRCANCKRGVVENEGYLSPEVLPLREPAGLEDPERSAWSEVRSCLSSGANTAAVMMCRKILLHIAVTQGLTAKNNKGRAPSFVEAVDYLEGEGIVTRPMRSWVDRIKDVGNEANHEITPVDAELALDVATFTEQLLRLTYEIPSLMAR